MEISQKEFDEFLEDMEEISRTDKELAILKLREMRDNIGKEKMIDAEERWQIFR
jgi:uncharacterized membrane protein (DUF106 family)